MLDKIEAINLKSINYSESSKIITVFSKEYGQMSLMAKGVKRSKKSNKGKLQTFMLNEYVINKKTDLGYISEIDCIDPFLNISKDYNKTEAAYGCIKIIYKIVQKNQKNDELYNLLKETLTNINNDTNYNDISFAFKRNLLRIEGILPKEENEYTIDRALNNYTNHI